MGTGSILWPCGLCLIKMKKSKLCNRTVIVTFVVEKWHYWQKISAGISEKMLVIQLYRKEERSREIKAFAFMVAVDVTVVQIQWSLNSGLAHLNTESGVVWDPLKVNFSPFSSILWAYSYSYEYSLSIWYSKYLIICGYDTHS